MISIIINNYNYANYLAQAIESALMQSYHAVEVIVVDDGSTDDSQAIIRSYGERIIPLFKANGGQASALNAGFVRSRGEIIIFLDADDLLLPETATRVHAAFATQPDASKVQYPMAIIDNKGLYTGQVKPHERLSLQHGDLRRHVLTCPFDLSWMATSGNAFAAWALRKILPIPEQEFRILADYYLVHLTALLGHVIALEEIGACYRVHDSNHYEPSSTTLDLGHIRQTVVHAQRTTNHIRQLADQLGLQLIVNSSTDQSVASLANRLVSRKLAPDQHPFGAERLWGIAWMGFQGSMRRFDVAPAVRILFMAWFLATTLSPKPMARWLAEKFFFPETRPRLNHLLQAIKQV